MKPNTYDEMIEAIQAANEGKDIQFCSLTEYTEVYIDCDPERGPLFAFNQNRYRVKSVRKEGWINIYPKHKAESVAHCSSTVYGNATLAEEAAAGHVIATVPVIWEE